MRVHLRDRTARAFISFLESGPTIVSAGIFTMFNVVSPQVYCVQSVGSPPRDPLDVRHVSKARNKADTGGSLDSIALFIVNLLGTSSTSTVLPIVDELFSRPLSLRHAFSSNLLRLSGYFALLIYVPPFIPLVFLSLPSPRAEAVPKAPSKVRMTMAILFDGRSAASALPHSPPAKLVS
ncbi:hypothetical protein DFH11DRAFT_1314272 [Phellopilus nigrolimitatus]|nr:hypothetical protein DFH11DRAFT_1314272 [Phellopilus nigrolimitatus]